MVIYLDALLTINFVFDFLILFFLSKILKKNVKKSKIIIGAIIGELSLIVLLINVNSHILIIFKIIFSFLMSLATFGKKNIIENSLYFFMFSLLLGGFIYYLKEKTDLKYGVLLIIAPFILYVIYLQLKKIKNYYSLKHKVDIYLNNGKIFHFNGLLDTGNMLKDPYKSRPILIVFHKNLEEILPIEEIIYVPFNSINNNGIMKCFKPSRVYIDGYGLKSNVLVGISKITKFSNDIDCIFGNSIMEEK